LRGPGGTVEVLGSTSGNPRGIYGYPWSHFHPPSGHSWTPSGHFSSFLEDFEESLGSQKPCSRLKQSTIFDWATLRSLSVAFFHLWRSPGSPLACLPTTSGIPRSTFENPRSIYGYLWSHLYPPSGHSWTPSGHFLNFSGDFEGSLRSQKPCSPLNDSTIFDFGPLRALYVTLFRVWRSPRASWKHLRNSSEHF